MRVYLDYNATAPVRPEVCSASVARLEEPLNASSVHTEGRKGRKVIEEARGKVAALVGADQKAVIFTGGGTEANNTVLSPTVQVGSRTIKHTRLLTSAIEHPCVLEGGRFDASAVDQLPVTGQGVVDLDTVKTILAEIEHPFVSVMLANNETGVLQPVGELANIVHRQNGFLHVDAVQAAGKIAIDIIDLDVDVLTLSAHKLGGPQGVGAIVSAHAGIRFPSLFKGGRQELGQRGGTENIAGIEGFGVAAEAALTDLNAGKSSQAFRDQLERGLRELSNEIVIFGENAARLPNTSNFSLPGKRAETAVIAYDMAGIAVSSGSACSSGKVGPSHVLKAMGIDDGQAEGAIRVSFGWNSTEADVTCFLEVTERMLGR